MPNQAYLKKEMGSAASVPTGIKPIRMCSGLLTIQQAQRALDIAPPQAVIKSPLNKLCRVGLSSSEILKRMLGLSIRKSCCPDWVIMWDLSNVPMTRRALDYLYHLLIYKDVWMVYLIGSEIDKTLLEEIEQKCTGRLHCELYTKNQDGSESELVDLRIADLIRSSSLLKNIELVCFTGDGNLEHGEFSIIAAVKAACIRDVRVHMYAPLGALSKAYVGIPNIYIIDWSSNSLSSSQRATPILFDFDSDLSSRSTSCSPPPPSSSGGSSRSPPPRVVVRDIPLLKGSINSAKK